MNKGLPSRKDGVPVAILCDQFQQRLQSPYDLVAGFTEFVPLHTALRMPRDTLDTVRFNRTFTIATMSLSGIGLWHDVRMLGVVLFGCHGRVYGSKVPSS